MRLGRYPFKAGIKHYMERKKGTWDDETTAPQRTDWRKPVLFPYFGYRIVES